MSSKKCCIKSCGSSSTREEDLGVTYHKFSKCAKLRVVWQQVTHRKDIDLHVTNYVCSRHFRKSDFQVFKDSKYILKSDAVPSIFPWTKDLTNLELSDYEMETSLEANDVESTGTVDNPLDNEAEKPLVQCDVKEKSKVPEDPDESTPDLSFEENDVAIKVNDPPETVAKNEEEQSNNSRNEKNGNEINNIDMSSSQDNSCSSEKKSTCLNDSKKADSDHLDAIKKFIEQQEKEIQKLEAEVKPIQPEIKASTSKLSELLQRKDRTPQKAISSQIALFKPNKTPEKSIKQKTEIKKEIEEHEVEKGEYLNKSAGKRFVINNEETVAVTSSVMEIILSESEAKLAKRQNAQVLAKQSITPTRKATNSSVALSVGSKVEAKDFNSAWYPAQIVEVDFDEMEVLVQYKQTSKKPDEWISVSSPRLRPIGSTDETDPPPEPMPEPSSAKIKEESKEVKPKTEFKVGDRCLAKWRDSRRFTATIQTDMGNDQYQIVFDDGFLWTCSKSRLSKMKQTSTEIPIPEVLPNTPSVEVAPLPGTSSPLIPFHTHLFDPTRDYLGSKSERREKKRKLNIKEIFNIGQKKYKKMPEDKPVVKKEIPKPRIIRKTPIPVPKLVPVVKHMASPVLKPVEDVFKSEVPDAVAAIIGTKVEMEEEKGKKELKIELQKVDIDFERAKLECETKADIKEKLPIDVKESEVPIDTIDVKEPEVPIDTIDVKESEVPNDTIDVKESEVPIDAIDVKESEVPIDTIDVKESEVVEVRFDALDQDDEVKDEEVKDDPTTDNTAGLETPPFAAKTEMDSPSIGIAKCDTVQSSSEATAQETAEVIKNKKKNLAKIRKAKKLRLMREQKAKMEVEKVKNELEQVKRQMEEMKKQVQMKNEMSSPSQAMESFLLPGEWCCKWVNGQPVGTVLELLTDGTEGKEGLPRRSVQVDDKRLPEGWSKHMVRRSQGHSAGKFDVVLISPDGKRLHNRTEMQMYLVTSPHLRSFEHALLDFGQHRKLSRRLGWDTTTEEQMEEHVIRIPASDVVCSPLMKKPSKRKSQSLKKVLKKKLTLKRPCHPPGSPYAPGQRLAPRPSALPAAPPADLPPDNLPCEEGYVYVGSLKVQIIDNLLRCPADACFKNFRNSTLLRMHIKHYHRDLRKSMGATPKVADLAYARVLPNIPEPEHKVPKLKVKIPKRAEEPKDESTDYIDVTHVTPNKIHRSQDSPKLRKALANRPMKRPKVLLPVKQSDSMEMDDLVQDIADATADLESEEEAPLDEYLANLDFESAISTHTVTKPLVPESRKGEKKRKTFAKVFKAKGTSEEDEWCGNSDYETMSSYPRSGTPDSKNMDKINELPAPGVSSECPSNEDPKDDAMYVYNETGEKIRVVHMKREEIINCHCGVREEDGLMIQCELCLCWQHALCHNIQQEADVPVKYTCSICLNPRRGRRTRRFLHDQDRLFEGLLPGARPDEGLRRSHELSGNLLRVEDSLHALRVQFYVSTKKDHPKLYLWSKDWDMNEFNYSNLSQDKLNSDYNDLNAMMCDIDKENLPVRADLKDISLVDMRTPPSEGPEGERFAPRDPAQLGTQSLLSGLLSSPGGASLDLQLSATDLENLAKSVQEAEMQRAASVSAPQPEAAIDNNVCRERLLRHIQRCQALIDARLDSVEAQVAELESQDPSFEDDETADFFPRTKQTMQMLLRDLETMEELGVIT